MTDALARLRQMQAADLPTRMAEVDTVLDAASPAMREALLVAFLDRLSRPIF